MTTKFIKTATIMVLLITYHEGNAQSIQNKQDTAKIEAIRYSREGSVCFSYTHYQIPLTPFYVLQPNRWFRHRHAPIIKLGWWYVPFISKRRCK